MRWRGNQAASRKSNNLLQGGGPGAKPWALSLHFVAASSTARSSGPNLAGSWCRLTKQETPSEPPGHCSTPWDHFQEPILHSQGRLSLPGTSPHIHFCFKVVVFFPQEIFLCAHKSDSGFGSAQNILFDAKQNVVFCLQAN